jgi:hypothetical protein
MTRRHARRNVQDAAVIIGEAATEIACHAANPGTQAWSLGRVLDHLIEGVAKAQVGRPVPSVLRMVAGADDGPLTQKVLRELDQGLEHLLGRALLVEELALAYEILGGAASLADPARAARRASGRYFTPPPLASSLACLALRGWDRRDIPSVLDPAAGAGVLLIHALRELAPNGTPRRPFASALHGIDVDATAVRLARALLWIECGDPSWEAEELVDNLRVADALMSRVSDWHSWFPCVFHSPRAGFRVILSNPPWNGTRALKSEFAASWDGDPQDFGQAWARHRTDQLGYAAALRAHDEYIHQGAGDRDLYKYFLERIHQLVDEGGRAGILMPAGFLRTTGAAELRRLYLNSGTFEVMAELINRQRLFPIHGMFRFLLAVFRAGESRGIECYQVGMTVPEEILSPRRTPQRLDPAFLRIVGGDFSGLPEVRTPQDAALLRKMHLLHPPLGHPEGPWHVSFTRELDMTLDRKLFLHVSEVEKEGGYPLPDGRWRTPDGSVLHPVYEGRMVQQYDAAAKSYVGGSGRSATWKPCKEAHPRPQFLVPSSVAEAKGGGLRRRPGYCDISGHANERTVIAALLPRTAVAGNKVPTVRFEPDVSEIGLYWLGVANSFVYDWLFRRWISTTLNYFYWRHLPFPRLDPSDPAFLAVASDVAELVHPSAREAASNTWGGLASWARSEARARIDAQVALLFEFSFEDFSHVMADFPLLDKAQPALPGEKRSTVTRDLALLFFAQLIGHADEAGLVERLKAAAELGAMPYSGIDS